MAYINGEINVSGEGQLDGYVTRMTPAGRLRKLLADRSRTIVAPGVYDGFSARIALEVGFDCLYMVSIFQCQFIAKLTVPDRRRNGSLKARSA